MGRTCPTYRMLLEGEISSWKRFSDSLSEADRRALEWIFDASRRHASACSAVCRLDPFDAMAVCALVSLFSERGVANNK